MFFKNKITGVTHEVIHEDTIKRCQNDPNYEEVKQLKSEPKTDSKKDNNSKQTAKRKANDE